MLSAFGFEHLLKLGKRRIFVDLVAFVRGRATSARLATATTLAAMVRTVAALALGTALAACILTRTALLRTTGRNEFLTPNGANRIRKIRILAVAVP